MPSNHKNKVGNIVLLICALLFASVEGIHSLVHHPLGQHAKLLQLPAKEKSAKVASRQNAKLQQILLVCPACVEYFVAVADRSATPGIITEKIWLRYSGYTAVFAVPIIHFCSRAPPYFRGLFVMQR